MMTVRSLSVSVLFALSSIATASVRMDENAGTWRDNFTDLAGLVQNRQGAFFSPSGYTVDPAVQRWSQPFSTTGMYDSFSARGGYAEPPIQIVGKGSAVESITLWTRMYEPGAGMIYATSCESRTNWICPVDESLNNIPNGWHSKAIDQVPYLGAAQVYAAGWDTAAGTTEDFQLPGSKTVYKVPLPNGWGLSCLTGWQCGTSYTASIGRFHDTKPLYQGPNEKALVAGDTYGITFVASARTAGCHKTHTTFPYLMFEAFEVNSKTAIATATLYESDFIDNEMVTDLRNMTPFSINTGPLPLRPGGLWDFRVYSDVDFTDPVTRWHTHCTVLGPVWVMANKGTYTSPVLDTMSDTTKWVSIGWRMDQSTMFVDSRISPIPQGSPITPIKISYRIGNNPASLPVVNSVESGGEKAAGVIGMNTVVASSTVIRDGTGNTVFGRYLSYDATLYSRHAAAEYDSDLAPYPEHAYFGAYRPILHELYVTYFVTVARAISAPVAPRCCIRRWRTLNYVVEKPLGTRVEVGVTAPDGSLLLANVAPGADLSVINPFNYPAIALCATLYCDPADYTRRPVLKAWEIQWDPDGSVIHMYDVAGGGNFKGNGIHPARGEEFKMQVCVRQSGHASVEVHDAAGQLIRKLLDEDSAPGVRIITWNGRNERGEIVAAGVYFISARVPGGQQVRRLAVIR